MTSDLDLELDQRVQRLLAPGVVDMHFDLPLDLYDRRHEPGILETDFLPDLAAGGAGVLGVALYLEDKYLPELGLRVALDQVARLYAEVGRSDRFAICRSYAEIEAARRAGRIALLITMEGVEPLGTDLDLLRVFYELGVRSVGLTHARRNAAGDGAIFAAGGSSPARLSAFGKRVIQACDELGILIDLAHLNPAGVDDVLTLTDRPVLLSHTNPRVFHDLERLSTDAQLRAVAARGGVIGLTAVLLSAQRELATIDHFIDQLLYTAALVGIDHVGLGLDFIEFLLKRWTPEERAALEKYTTPPSLIPDLHHHGHLRNLVRRLIARGFGDEEIAKVLYGNWLRVFRACL
jgi:membrane dipeptidase